MEILLQRIVTDQFRSAFSKILVNDKLTAKQSFKLLKYALEIKKHQDHFDQINQKICEKYAIRKEDGTLDLLANEKGSLYQFDNINMNLLNEELAELLAEKVSIPDPLLTDSDVENMNLNVCDIESLLDIVITWSDK